MPSYLHPGVYVEEISSGSKPISGASTSTAAFVGFTNKGPVGEPVLIHKWSDYVARFGGIRDTGTAQGDPMGFTVAAFFQNGGTAAYIVRLADGAAKAEGYINHPAVGNDTEVLVFTALDEGRWADGTVVTIKEDEEGAYVVEVGALNERSEFVAAERFEEVSLESDSARFLPAILNGSSERVTVAVKAMDDTSSLNETLLGRSVSGDLAEADLDLSELDDDADRQLQVTLDGGNTPVTVTIPQEDYSGDLAALAAEIQARVRGQATTEPRKSFTCTVEGTTLVLTSGTRLKGSAVSVAAGDLATALKLGEANGGSDFTGAESRDAMLDQSRAELSGGDDGEGAALASYQAAFTGFLKYRDISILCVPGHAWDANGKAVVQAAVAHAEKIGNRMVIVDPPLASTPLTTKKAVNDLALPSSTYTALYYPWVKVANPFHHAERNPGAPRTVLVPPSGYAAGMWSKIDGRRGVWKAPAGVETGLLGLDGLQYTVEDGEQDSLNPLGVNVLRSRPGYGPVIWGTRTLATNADPEWRYVPVRRTAMFIEESIYNGIQWAVFEPNDHRLWSALRSNIDAFMNGLYRSGAFQGGKASDAYFVRCGLDDTMTQGDIDRGQVIVEVGFAPLKPAEFVIVRIQQKVGQ